MREGGAKLAMDRSEYWIGRGVDYSAVWNAYQEGVPYIQKYFSSEVYLLRLEFKEPLTDRPLFNHEAIYKTLKGYFHDLKYLCLPREVYNAAGPLYLYKIDRGSGIWDFLAGLRELLLFGTTLSDQKVIGQKLENVQRKLDILRTNFGNRVHPEDFVEFMNASSSPEIDRALQKLFEQRLSSVKLSKTRFMGSIKRVEASLIELSAESGPEPGSTSEPDEGPTPTPTAGSA